jgi:hypothetical protein
MNHVPAEGHRLLSELPNLSIVKLMAPRSLAKLLEPMSALPGYNACVQFSPDVPLG